VAARVEGDPQALLGGEPDDGQHVFRRHGENDPDRPLDGGQGSTLGGQRPSFRHPARRRLQQGAPERTESRSDIWTTLS
jgi:hypothetical protein